MRSCSGEAKWDQLKKVPFFSGLADADRNRLLEVMSKRTFPKHAVILMDGQTKSYMYFILCGKVKVVQSDSEGKEQILAIHGPGDFFGEMALLDGKTVPASVVAMEDCRIAFLAEGEFHEYFLKNVDALKCIVGLLCLRLRESWMMVRVLRLKDAENRVRAILEHIAGFYGVKDSGGIIIPMTLTHQEIADYAALARETVTRVLQRFSESGEIEIMDNRNIRLTHSFVTCTPARVSREKFPTGPLGHRTH